MDFDRTLALCKINEAFEWHKWMNEIPYLQFPSDWLVKAIPPFNTGIIRYWVTKPGLKDRVSIYLDCYDTSGCVGQPYWEIYPIDGDCERFLMNETKELLDGIGRALKQLQDHAEQTRDQSE